MYYYFSVVLISLLRSIVFTYYFDQPTSLWIGGILDLAFVSIFSYWVYKQKQLNTKLLLVYLLPIFGSVIWNYQVGYTPLLISLPFLVLVFRSKDDLSTGYIKELLQLGVNFVAYPFLIVFQLAKKLKNLATKASAIGQYLVFITVGIFAGLFIIVILAFLDKEFALWLTNIKQILIYIKNFILSLLAYSGLYLWFFYGPIKTPTLAKSLNNQARFLGIFKIVALIVTALLISYGLYDTYILLRLFKALSLVYENVGKNTQLYFVEMAAMGGLILFLSSFLLEKMGIISSTQKESKEIKVLKPLLVFSTFLLLLPLYNLFRALFFVYIPDFGLTARRLFGLYSILAFLISFIYLVFQTFTAKKQALFSNVYIWFFASLTILVFVVPNNLVIYKSQFSRYLNNKDGDMAYIMKLNTGKWSGMLSNWEEDKNNANDTLLKWNNYEKYRDLVKAEEYKQLTFKNLNNEVTKLSKALENQNYAEIKTNNVSSSDYYDFVFPYTGSIPNFHTYSVPSYYVLDENLQNRRVTTSSQNPGFGSAQLALTQDFYCTNNTCQSLYITKTIYLQILPTYRNASLSKLSYEDLSPVWFSKQSFKGETYADYTDSFCNIKYDYNRSSACESAVRSLLIKYDLQGESLQNELPLNFMIELVDSIAKSYDTGNSVYEVPVTKYEGKPGYYEDSVRIENPQNLPTEQIVVPEKPSPGFNIAPVD